ncbi:DUF6152 family protein [Candidatus Rariloculus sp.]|uniref:DUF6152 family protein n=1 Tax=Candidatus Rariloculus sp. TaxID=3101265 RepID=UPI003D0A285F
MKRNLWVGLVVVSALAFTASASAHHSFAAQYDADKRIEFEGTVTRMEWMSPHIYFYVDVRDASGDVTSYAVEGGAPTRLYRQGWQPDTLQPGDTVSVEGALARNGSPTVNASTITKDGRRLFAGSSNPDDATND